ncbi:MAG: hypothetical protein LBE36_06500 [Flavobacteriaceae bacterium]|jgi:hypothetical protein|nr:hypothetical protein [Flavobacteriaceae bacterium]
MWKVTTFKYQVQRQEVVVKSLIMEMAEYSYAVSAEQFEDHFKRLIKDISCRNNFSADLLYKVVQRNQKSVEVWKTTLSGDFKYKMFMLEYIKDQ